MTIKYSKRFRKQFQNLRSAEQQRFWNRLELFIANSFDPKLRNHALAGRFQGYRSIDIGGDLRAIYQVQSNGTIIIFELIGSHSQLYG